MSMLVDCSNCHTQLNLPARAKSIRCALCQAVTPVADSDQSSLQPSYYAGSLSTGLEQSPDQSLYPMMLMHKSERMYEVGKVTDEEQAKQRRLRSILNKLTSHNFVKMLYQVKQVNIDNADTLSGLVAQIVDKALMEPAFVEVYANFCSRLAVELPGFSDGYKKITFKRFLLNKCQQEFEREEEAAAKRTEEDREEARRCKLGNISLICELCKKRVFPQAVMHVCINKLLGFNQNDLTPDEEDIEALCILMGTLGEMVYYPKTKERMHDYIDKMFQLSNNMSLSSRVRFMLKDAIDKWNKGSSGPVVQGWDLQHKMSHPARVNHGVFRTTRGQYAGRIVSGRMRYPGPQMQRNNSDSERWQRTTGYPKGLNAISSHPVMLKAERKYEVGKVSYPEHAKQRRIRSILEKLTPHNFGKLFYQVKQVNIDNADTLSGLVGQIFDRAVMEPTFVEVYANFCSRLAVELPGFGDDNEKITFKRLLLNKCQEEFERGEREANRSDEEGEIEPTEEQQGKARRRMLGNIIFIGELYKKGMLTERIMHECIKKLLGFDQNVNPEEEAIEALCNLMCTIGVMIDHQKAKEHMDVYFEMMFKLSNNMSLSSRVRFMLKDAIDLRKNKWQQRGNVEGPKEIKRGASSCYSRTLGPI